MYGKILVTMQKRTRPSIGLGYESILNFSQPRRSPNLQCIIRLLMCSKDIGRSAHTNSGKAPTKSLRSFTFIGSLHQEEWLWKQWKSHRSLSWTEFPKPDRNHRRRWLEILLGRYRRSTLSKSFCMMSPRCSGTYLIALIRMQRRNCAILARTCSLGFWQARV